MIKLERTKKRNLLLSFLYKIQYLLPLNAEKKLKLFLNLTWIFERLAHEQVFKTQINIRKNIDVDFLINLVPENASILDVGCGNGYIEERLSSKTTDIVGLDINSYAIDIAKKKFMNSPIQFVCADFNKYLVENRKKKFDIIILSHILEHVLKPEKLILDLVKISKFIYIEVPDFEASHLNFYRETLKVDLIYTDDDHLAEFDRKSLEELIIGTGLVVLNTEFRHGVMKYWCTKHN